MTKAGRARWAALAVVRQRSLLAAAVIGMLWTAAMFACFFLTTLYLQLVLGYSPLQTGLAFLPMNLIMGVLSAGASARLGLAVLASVAAGRTRHLLAAGHGHLAALAGGYHVAYLTGAAAAVLAAVIAARWLRPAIRPAAPATTPAAEPALAAVTTGE